MLSQEHPPRGRFMPRRSSILAAVSLELRVEVVDEEQQREAKAASRKATKEEEEQK